MKKYISLVISLLCIPTYSFADTGDIPKSTDKCGPRYEQFKKHFEKLGLSEHSARLFSDYAIEGFVNDNKDIEQNKVSELRSLLKSVFTNQATAKGGYVEIASCYYSINRPYFNFEESERTYNIVKYTSMGSQPLDWIARQWCAENWGSVLSEVQVQSKFYVPYFTPIMMCGK